MSVVSDSRIPSTATTPTGGTFTIAQLDGQVTAVTDPDGVTTTYGYDTVGNLTSLTNGANESATFTYDAAGRLLTSTSPLGLTTEYSYDAAGRVTSAEEPTGATTLFTYDDAGRITGITDPATGSRTFSYNQAGLPVAETDALGEVTTYEWNAAGDLVEAVRPGGATTIYAYGPLRRLSSVTDPAGGVTAYEYDDDGNITKITDATSGEVEQTWSPDGQLTSMTDGDRVTVSYTYDADGRLTSVDDPSTGIVTYAYDDNGRLASETDALGNVTSYAYTAAGRVSTVTDPAGGVWTWGYDAAGRPVTVTDPLGGVSTTTYDADGRVVARETPAGLVTTLVLDGAGRPTSITDPIEGTRSFSYDLGGRLLSETDATGGVVSFTWTARGELATATDALGVTTSFAYDARGNRISRTSPDGAVESWGYDAADRLISHTDIAGRTTTIDRDPSGRPTLFSFPGGRTETRAWTPGSRLDLVTWTDGPGSLTADWAYDAAGRAASLVDSTGTTEWVYDAVGRVASETRPGVGTVGYGWDAAGRLSALTWPDGSVLSYGRDAAGRVDELSTPGLGTVVLGRDADGRLVSEGGAGLARTWDVVGGSVMGLEETIDGSTLTQDLTRDSAGRVSGSAVGGVSTSFSYDPAGQLVAAGSADFAFDALGNMTFAQDPVRKWDVGSSREIAQQWSSPLSVECEFAWDGEGRLLEDCEHSYTWDAAGRLATRTGPDGTASYEWSGDGTLVGLGFDDGTSTEELDLAWASVDGVDQLVGVDDGALTRIVRHDHPLATLDGGGADWLGVDAFGSVTRGDLAVAGAYDPWGLAGTAEAEWGLGYRGELTVGGLVHLRAREYHPGLGRFVSPDPLAGVPGTTVVSNPYHYANNDPLNMLDPWGLRPVDDDYMGSCGIGGKVLSWLGGSPCDFDLGLGVRDAVVFGSGMLAGAGCMAVSGGNVALCGGIGNMTAGVVDRRLSGQNPWDPVAMGWDALTGAAGGKLVDELAGVVRRGVPTRVAAPGVSDDLAPRAPGSVGDDMAGAACSFSGATLVLMADGTRKPISEVEEGDYVYATDPETGESGPREVIATLPHADQLLTLRTSSGEIVTTEDHKYWNATDNQWQESQDLDEGDRLLSADGDIVTVEGLDWSTVHTDAAYDLTIADLHAFYVGAGVDEVLVHNCGELTGSIGRLADDLGYTSREIRDAILELPRSDGHEVSVDQAAGLAAGTCSIPGDGSSSPDAIGLS